MVSTIATEQEIRVKEKNKLGFNTVNGKYYCNDYYSYLIHRIIEFQYRKW